MSGNQNQRYRQPRPNNRNQYQNYDYQNQYVQQNMGYGYDQYQQMPYQQQYDMGQQQMQQPRYNMNSNANSFNYNPNAPSFTPPQFQSYQPQSQSQQQPQQPQQQYQQFPQQKKQYFQPPPPSQPYQGQNQQNVQIQNAQPQPKQPLKADIKVEEKPSKDKIITDTNIKQPKEELPTSKGQSENGSKKKVQNVENWEDIQVPDQSVEQSSKVSNLKKNNKETTQEAIKETTKDPVPQQKQIDSTPNKKKNEDTAKEANVAQRMEDLSIQDTTPNVREQREQQQQQEAEENEEQRRIRIKQVLEQLNEDDKREHVNLVFIGHVDAGKSTTAGQILILTGNVDQRTIEKYEKDAKDRNREGWYMAYVMDINDEERDRGKTVEVGRATFETPKKRYTILDAPGHKNYVPNMIGATTQADVGILLVSARGGEFETGFERGGQTREHAQIAKTLGVNKLLVLVNKLDDSTVALPDGQWDQARYNSIVKSITPYLQKECGYNVKKDVIFVPVASMFGKNFKERVPEKECPWYKGQTLFEALDSLDPFARDPYAPVRLPVYDRYKDVGTVIMGKLEQGLITKGDSIKIMPMGYDSKVTNVFRDDQEVTAVQPGENIKLKIAGIDEDEIQPGYVVCSPYKPVAPVTRFKAQVIVQELLEHKSIFSQGYRCVLHIHSAIEECEIKEFHAIFDKATKQKKPAKFCKSGAIAFVVIEVERSICVEKFETLPQLGRFTLRDEGKTVAIGKVTLLPRSQVEK